MKLRRTALCGAFLASGVLGGCRSHPTGPGAGWTHPSLNSVDAVALPHTPFAVAIAPTGVIYVTELTDTLAARGSVPSNNFTTAAAVGPLPSQVRMSPDGWTAYIGNQNAGKVTFVDVATNRPFTTVAVPGPSSILTIGVSPSGERLYALTDTRGVYVIDVALRQVIDSIPASRVGEILAGVAFHPFLPRMYVASRAAGVVTVIDIAMDTVVTTYFVGGSALQNVAVARDGSELYATDIQQSGLVVWNLATGSATFRQYLIGSGQVRNAFDVAVTPDNAQLYVSALADGKVYVLDRATRALVRAIATGGFPRYIAFDAGGTEAAIPNESGWVTFVH